MPVSAALLALTAAAGTANAVPHSVTPDSTCPSGYVCIYSGTTKSSSITYEFYTYGVHKIYNQYGSHLVFNNQTQAAVVFLCNDAACNDIQGSEGAGAWDVWNLTPINAVQLAP